MKEQLCFRAHFLLGGGIQLCTLVTGILTCGAYSAISSESHIVCANEITIGNHSVISWNTQIMDTDFHKIMVDDKVINPDQKIRIGNNVWICSHSIVAKGVSIPDGCIIAAGSYITGKTLLNEKSVITGMPFKVLRENVEWKI